MSSRKNVANLSLLRCMSTYLSPIFFLVFILILFSMDINIVCSLECLDTKFYLDFNHNYTLHYSYVIYLCVTQLFLFKFTTAASIKIIYSFIICCNRCCYIILFLLLFFFYDIIVIVIVIGEITENNNIAIYNFNFFFYYYFIC